MLLKIGPVCRCNRTNLRQETGADQDGSPGLARLISFFISRHRFPYFYHLFRRFFVCLCGAARCRNKYIFQIFIFEAIHILFLFSDDPIIGLACFMLSFQAVPHKFVFCCADCVFAVL
jgi:hypothetical protein